MSEQEKDLCVSAENNTHSAAAVAPGKKLLLFGIGSCGIHIVNAFMQLPGSSRLTTAVIDTDLSEVENSPADIRIHAEAEWAVKSGLGCGGDIGKGERAISRERQNMTKVMTGYDYLIVCGGLGGGTATGGVRIAASVAKSLSIPAIFLLTTPFSFESYPRRKNAEDSLTELFQLTDALAIIPNDLLFSTLPPDAGVQEAFDLASSEMAKCVFGCSELLTSNKVVGGEYSDILPLLRKKRSNCSLGIGEADGSEGLDRCGLALSRLLDSPFLGGISHLDRSDALLFTITGGPDLGMAELKQTLERASRIFPEGIPVTSGVTIHPEFGSKVLLTLLAICYDKEASGRDTLWHPEEQKEKLAESAGPMEQGILDLQTYSKGIFAGSMLTKYKGEDLDIPTFQRKNLTIDKGTTLNQSGHSGTR